MDEKGRGAVEVIGTANHSKEKDKREIVGLIQAKKIELGYDEGEDDGREK